MTLEQARYDIKNLPLRQAMLRAMSREPHHTIEGMKILADEFAANRARLAKARAIVRADEPGGCE